VTSGEHPLQKKQLDTTLRGGVFLPFAVAAGRFHTIVAVDRYPVQSCRTATFHGASYH
jgi:hypothetical protein